MKKIRRGNDFTHEMLINRNGEPVDLSSALYAKLTVRCFSRSFEVPFEVADIGKIKINFRAEDVNQVGVYNLRFDYAIPDESMTDGDLKGSVDEDAFRIVPTTAEADTL